MRNCVLIKHIDSLRKKANKPNRRKQFWIHGNPSALCGQNGSRLQASKTDYRAIHGWEGEAPPHKQKFHSDTQIIKLRYSKEGR